MRILDRLFRAPEPARPSAPPPPPPLDVYKPDASSFRLLSPEGRLLDLPRNGTPFPIGRARGSAVKLEAECVSREHALGCYKDDQLWISDKGSRNGTWLDGQRLKPRTWVAVPTGATLEFGGPAGRLNWGEPPEPLHIVGHKLPQEGQVVLIGRKQEAGIRFPAEEAGVSRRHAELKLEGGRLYLRDTHSQNGTSVNGQPLEPGRWVALPEGARVQFGSSQTATLELKGTLPPPPAEPVRETRLPDGRAALVQNLSDGRLRVSKVDLELTSAEGVKTLNGGPLEPGVQVILEHGGRPRILTFLGDNRFGHTDEYTPEDFQNYLQAQTDHLEAEAKAQAERTARRAQAQATLRAQETQRLGLTADMSTLDMAGAIYNGQGKLAADGGDLWPPEVTAQVETWKRRQLDEQPGLKEAGLTEIRLQQWLAEQRGEFLLFRGIQGPFDPSGESRFWTNELGSAMGYAADPDQEANLLMLRIPRSDIPRFYRNVGCLPGRNPYAEVYEIGGHDLKPVPALNSREHPDIFAAYRANQAIQDDAAGQADFRRLDHVLRGEY